MKEWAIAAVALVLGSGCDGAKEKAPLPPPPSMTGRSNVVAAKDTGATAAKPAPHPTAAPAGAARQICQGQTPHAAPKGAVKTVAAPSSPELPAAIPFGVGKWTWVNLWAAWCGPCKEEIPRLLNWKDRLAAAGVAMDVAFVSLDDDARQLERFLEGQPASGGLRSSYWLPEGETRTTWLAALGVRDAPQLPLQALVAPSGQVACVIQGAVEDRDYAAVAAFLGARK